MKSRAFALVAVLLLSAVTAGGVVLIGASGGHAMGTDAGSSHAADGQSQSALGGDDGVRDDLHTGVSADQGSDAQQGANGKAKATGAKENEREAGTSATEERSRGGNGKAKLGPADDADNTDASRAGGNGKAKRGDSGQIAVSAPPFGEVPVGDSIVVEAQITNEGTAPVTVENLTIAGIDAGSFEIRSPEPPFEIAPGETAPIEIVFTPQTSGDLNATLVVTTANASRAETPLTGVGIISESPTSTTTSPTSNGPSTATTEPEPSALPEGPAPTTSPSEQSTTTPGQSATTEQPTTTAEQSPTTPEETSTTTSEQSPTTTTTTTTPGQPTTTPEGPPTTTTQEPTTTTTTQEPTTTTTTTTPGQPTTTPEGPPTTTTPEQPPDQSATADLAVTKTVNTTNATVGDTVSFTVSVTNNGPDPATNVSATEMLEDGLAFQSAETTQGEYNTENSIYAVGMLANGDTATLTLVATIESADNTMNAVEVTSETPDPNEPNNNDTSDPNPQVADLSLTKNVNESTPNVGDNIAYTLDLTNNGPNATSNVSVEEVLPDGLGFVSANTKQGSYDAETDIWTVGELTDGDDSTLTIVATVESAENVTNTARVNFSDTYDPDSTPGNDNPNEDDQDNVTVNGQQADLAVTKTVTETNATVGDNVEFTIDVTNNGPDTATNVSAYETLDSGLSFQSASTTQGAYNDTTNVYSVGTLANGETATLTLVATIKSTDHTTNAVEVTSETPDPNDPNNNDTAKPSPELADLSLTKTVNESAPNIGDNIEYTLDLMNNGPNATSNVSVKDGLPAGVTFVGVDASQGSYDAEAGTWSVGELASDDESTLTIVATVESAENVTNTAQVNSSDVYDPDSTPDNEQPGEDDQDSVTVNGQQADLAVIKTVEESNATVGDDVVFTIDVTNNGPDTAINVNVYETLDSGLRFVNASAIQGEYNEDTNVYDVGTLANGDTATLTLTATVESTNNTTNAVEVTSETPDPNEPNNNDSVTPSPTVSDLNITKTVDDTDATVGDTVDFTVNVTNDGPDTATNVSVNEALGEGLNFINADTSQGDYDADTGVYDVGTLANGDTATLTLTATIESANNTTNAVTTTGDQFDPNDLNNNDTASPMPTVADLSLTKDVSEATPNVGDDIEYTLTLTNNGPNATSGVTVTEELPNGLSYVSSDGDGSYDAEAGVWTVGDLDDGEESTLSIVATVESAENVTNIAQVNSSDVYDPDSTPGNDNPDEDDQDMSTVNGQQADLAVTKTINETNTTVGDDVTFTVSVTNNGPDTATNVSVNENLGEGLSFVDAETSTGEYNTETNVYDVGTLENGDTATLTLTATIESADDTANVVEVTSETPDPNEPNDNDTSDPNPRVADLSLTKTINESAPATGSNVAYTLTLTNNGPNATSNVTVEEMLPDGMSYVNSTADQGIYTAETGIWTVGDLDDGDESTLSIVATVESAENVTNVAEVNSSDTYDPNSTPNNNESGENDQDSTTLQPTAPQCSIQLGDVDAPDSVSQGDTATITANVTNTGLENGCGANATLNATGNSTRAVDIPFLIDTSASTQSYINKIANQLDDFSSDLNAQGIDARFAVISYGGDGYVTVNREYTNDSDQAIAALNNLNSNGGVERNYGAIQAALDQLQPRDNANTFIIDVTDEDSDTPVDGVPESDPSQDQLVDQIDNAGATFIAVSPTQENLKNKENGYNPDQDIKVLANRTKDGHWVRLFKKGGGANANNLNNFVDKFEDIVTQQVNQGISRDQSITLDAKQSGTLSFSVDTSSFRPTSKLKYTVTVGGDQRTGTITITGSGGNSMTANEASLSAASSSTVNTVSQAAEDEVSPANETPSPSGENESEPTTVVRPTTTEPNATKTTTTSTENATESVPTTTTTETPTTTTEPSEPITTTEIETPTDNVTEPAAENTTTEPATATENTTVPPATDGPTATSEATETSTEADTTTTTP